MKKTLSIIVIFLWIGTTFAQDCPCNKALEGNTQNEFTTQTGRDFKQATSVFFSQDFTFWENYSSYQNRTTEMDAGYALFSASFSDNMTREEKKAKFESMKTIYKTTNNVSQNDYLFISQKIAAETVYNQWIKCVELQCASQDRMVISYSITGDLINVTLKWIARNNQRYTTLGSIQPLNAEYQSGDLYQYYKIQSQSSLTSSYKRVNPHQDVVITVNVKDYDALQVVIPGLEVENPSSNMPVGTIIASVLDYSRFCKLNEQSDVLNLKKSKWAPCDGRSVAGSKYAEYEANVPDFRGVFLRGLNDFGVKGVDVVAANQADPDGNGRPANNLQQDDFKDHTHTYRKYIDHGWTVDYGNKQSLVQKGDFDGNQTTGSASNLNNGGKETRPKNKTVYYYIKINK